MRTITAYFDSVQAAEQAAFNLATRVGGVRAKVYDARNTDRLGDLSLPEGDATTLREGFRRGGGVVHAEVPDGRFEEVADTLEASGSVDLDVKEAEWRKEGRAGSTASTTTNIAAAVPPVTGVTNETSAPATATFGSANATTNSTSGAATGSMVERLGAADDEARIPVAEERLRVGKREVGHGRVRIRSYVVETPVQEQVTLHQEHVAVERRPTDRPLTGADDALFRERTIEATETAEEAVVAKEARVKEELVVRKTADDRTETVSDTVRRTEVEVDDNRTAAKTSPATPRRDPGAV
ncbi:YsnF/AvaK domain-containing protein [Belnapia rosea]|uniref:YsnF/AvaK domain-containing protein n=1 Tax=Belnapia rosea TaxID=938405 RepID=UPI0008832CE6|nr:YsnF/AvaK domain-containing protein [Belnapia rosea]SDB21360.1 conserved domain-containing protein [Belnapia rosea]